MSKVFLSLMRLTKNELKNYDLSSFNEYDAVIKGCCQRCGYKIDANNCTNCCELGKITKEDKLYQKNLVSNDVYINKINKTFKLTKLQQECSDFLIKNNNNILIHAVCGAGKTEITFDIIHKVLLQKQFVCFAITRKDILYEIKERLEKYFIGVKICVINSDENKFVDANIYVMTTNQILRFKNCFNLVIVDEVDAFPYEYNSKYDYAVNSSLVDNGQVVYLTATPSNFLIKKMLDTFVIYRRYHGYDLIVPKVKYSKLLVPINVFKCILINKRQQLIFVSNIDKTKQISDLLNKLHIDNVYVHSKHENRKQNIELFRSQKVNVLITTTILERGVTFKDIDVHVVDCSSNLYTASSLVQIAGRVGRHKDYQEGNVFFYLDKLTEPVTSCIKQIKQMNSMK